MKTMIRVLTLAVVALALLVPARLSAQATNVTGEWAFNVQTDQVYQAAMRLQPEAELFLAFGQAHGRPDVLRRLQRFLEHALERQREDGELAWREVFSVGASPHGALTKQLLVRE